MLTRHAACALSWFLLIVPVLTGRQSSNDLKSKPARKQLFVTSNYYWTEYTSGLTEFSFSLKNQSGKDAKKVRFRVIFIDRQGTQIHFEDSETSGAIPNGMTKRQSVSLDIDTGESVRHLSVSEKIEILSFEQTPAEGSDHPQ
jgi:hypothetical protein